MSLGLYCLSYAGQTITLNVVAPTLSDLGATLGGNVSISVLSTLLSAQNLGMSVGALVFGPVFDKRPSHGLLAGCLVVAAISTALLPHASWMPIMLSLSFLMGASAGAARMGANVLTVRSGSATAVQALHSFAGIGMSIAPVVVRVTAFSDAYRYAALMLVPVIVALMVFPSPVLQPHKAAASVEEEREKSARPLMEMVLVCLFIFLNNGCRYIFSGFMTLHNPAHGLQIITVYATCFAIGRGLGVLLSSLGVTPGRLLLMDICGACLGVSVAMLSPYEHVGAAIFGLSMSSVFPSVISSMRLSGKQLSVVMLSANAGTISLSTVCGAVFDFRVRHGFELVLVGCTGASLLVLVPLLTRMHRQKTPSTKPKKQQ